MKPEDFLKHFDENHDAFDVVLKHGLDAADAINQQYQLNLSAEELPPFIKSLQEIAEAKVKERAASILEQIITKAKEALKEVDNVNAPLFFLQPAFGEYFVFLSEFSASFPGLKLPEHNCLDRLEQLHEAALRQYMNTGIEVSDYITLMTWYQNVATDVHDISTVELSNRAIAYIKLLGAFGLNTLKNMFPAIVRRNLMTFKESIPGCKIAELIRFIDSVETLPANANNDSLESYVATCYRHLNAEFVKVRQAAVAAVSKKLAALNLGSIPPDLTKDDIESLLYEYDYYLQWCEHPVPLIASLFTPYKKQLSEMIDKLKAAYKNAPEADRRSEWQKARDKRDAQRSAQEQEKLVAAEAVLKYSDDFHAGYTSNHWREWLILDSEYGRNLKHVAIRLQPKLAALFEYVDGYVAGTHTIGAAVVVALKSKLLFNFLHPVHVTYAAGASQLDAAMQEVMGEQGLEEQRQQCRSFVDALETINTTLQNIDSPEALKLQQVITRRLEAGYSLSPEVLLTFIQDAHALNCLLLMSRKQLQWESSGWKRRAYSDSLAAFDYLLEDVLLGARSLHALRKTVADVVSGAYEEAHRGYLYPQMLVKANRLKRHLGRYLDTWPVDNDHQPAHSVKNNP